MGWEPLLHLYCVYYPGIVRELYINMVYKMDKDLSITISVVKGVRINLDRVRLVSILGIFYKGNAVSVDSNWKSIQEDPDRSYKMTTNRLEIHPRRGIADIFFMGVNFSTFYNVL